VEIRAARPNATARNAPTHGGLFFACRKQQRLAVGSGLLFGFLVLEAAINVRHYLNANLN